MLHDEFVKFQEQISRQIRKQNCQLLGHFKEIQFTQADWMQIKHLNDELEVSDYKIWPMWFKSLIIFLC